MAMYHSDCGVILQSDLGRFADTVVRRVLRMIYNGTKLMTPGCLQLITPWSL